MANEIIIRITGKTLADGTANTEFDLQAGEWDDEATIRVLETLAYGMIAFAVKNPDVTRFAGMEAMKERLRNIAGVNEKGEDVRTNYDPRDGIVL